MRAPTIARNYAEALFTLGERTEETARFADLIEGVGGAVEADATVRLALESPRVTKARKQALLASALADLAPETFIRYLSAIVKRGRQSLLPTIAREYLGLVDAKFNRVHASVVMAREPDAALQNDIARRLTDVLGQEVIPHFREDRALLGGMIVRVGDRVMDGSLRRRLTQLRRVMLARGTR